MPVTVLAFVTINEDQPRALAEYFKVTDPLLRAAGARIVQRFEVAEAIVGPRPAKTVIIVEYPDRAAVDMVFESPAYKAVIPVRDIAFADYQVTVVEAPTPPPTAAATP